MTTLKKYVQDYNPKNTALIWRELIPRKVIFGKFDYQVWVTDHKYEITRYNRSNDDISTAISGNLFDCTTDEERFAQIMDDLKMLVTQIQEDYDGRHDPPTEIELEYQERQRLLSQ